MDYDAFGRIYEYFLGEFARTEGQKGGEFYTPSCIVRLRRCQSGEFRIGPCCVFPDAVVEILCIQHEPLSRDFRI